tara:strand:- start:39 stop:1034 length:996 start_codon:yes stop_codon:yes gene_type:complete
MYKYFLTLAVLLLPLSLFPQSSDAIIGDVEIETGCIGDTPFYNINYVVWNLGNEEITNYCIEIWNEDYYQCFSSDLFGAYGIPPGEGQFFTTPYFEMEGPGNLFVMSVDDVNDEIVTGNNNTTVFLPEIPECPVECLNDTITIILPPDTIIQTQIDTVITHEYVYLTDTLIQYVDVYVNDTTYIYITEFDTDTIYVDNTLLIYLTDTITNTIEIDCNTGLPCNELIIDSCWPWNVFIPNVLTPNNDGINDIWEIIFDLECWVDVEFKIYNRWGGLIFEGYGGDYSSYPYWDGSMQGGPTYVANGVYVYTFYARKYNSPEVYQRSGHLTVLR